MTTLEHAEPARRRPREHEAPPRPPRRQRRRSANWWRYLVGLLAIVFALFPVVYIISAAFNPIPSLARRAAHPGGRHARKLPQDPQRTSERSRSRRRPRPSKLVREHHRHRGRHGRPLGVLGALAAYAFARFRFRGRRMGMLVPAPDPDVPDVPGRRRDLPHHPRVGDVFPRIGLEHADGRDPRLPRRRARGQHVADEGVPRLDPDSARRVRARGRGYPGQVFWGIILPLAAPVLAVVGLLSYIATINEFIIASACSRRRTSSHSRWACTGSSTTSTRRMGAVLRRGGACGDPSRRPLLLPPALHHRGPDEGGGQGLDGAAGRPAPRRLGALCARAACRARRRDDRAPARAARHAADAVAVRYVRRRRAEGVGSRDRRRDGYGRLVARDVPRLEPGDRYRWLLSGGDYGYAWLNGAGVVRYDVPDADDFVATPDPGGPDWHLESVVYEVFPDRFASSGLDVEPPEWARAARVGRPARPAAGRRRRSSCSAATSRGSRQRLDHVEELGANVIFLTPIFPAGSTHRYDATTFDAVDPLLGGDDALVVARGGRPRARHPHPRRPDDEPRGRRARVVRAARNGRARRSASSSSSTKGWSTATRAGTTSRPCPSSITVRASSGAGSSGDGSSSRRGCDRRSPRRLADRRREHDRRRGDTDAGGSRTWRALGGARGQAGCARGRGALARRSRRPPRGGWHGTMNYAGFTRPAWCVAARGRAGRRVRRAVPRAPGRRAAARRPRRGRDDAPLPGGRPVAARRSTPGCCSTATTRRGSGPWQARGSASSSGSACR